MSWLITVLPIAVLLAWLALLGIRETEVHAQAPFISAATAFFALLTFVAFLVVAVLLVLSLAVRRLRYRAPITVEVAVVLILITAVVVGAISTPRPAEVATVPAATPGSLRVLEWNVSQGAVPPEHMLNLIHETKPDIVVLAELYATNASADQFSGKGIPAGYTAIGTPGIAVTVLVAKRLGTYRAGNPDDSGATSGFVARPPIGSDSPEFLAVHLSRQTPRGDVTGWHAGLRWVASHCNGPNTIAVGDFNTDAVNVPSGALGSCRFPHTAEHVGLSPTWPTILPPDLGTTIDHVLVGSHWHTEYLRTLTGPSTTGSDHRPTFAVLTPSK